ncbi:hypothetical protein SAY87_026523 [Trapa incisa]|uniref:RING-type domain-containing protein n=1 Tax=Trapa incisa TaxID=236973 RepID=A0AAN7GUN4_9MYRT|nr:hypothetical protein SAY87_026523 [Trapa incisa]
MSAAEGSNNLLGSFSFRSREAPPAANVHRDLAGLSLDDILGTETHKPQPPPQLYPSPSQITRTLIDIIRDEPDHSSYKTLVDDSDRKAWRSFKDHLKIRRAGCAWTPSIPTPSSDGPIINFRKNHSSSLSAPLSLSYPHCISDTPRSILLSANMDEDSGSRSVQFQDQQGSRPVMARRTSVRISGEPSECDESPCPTPPGPQFSRHNSTRAASARFLNRSESSVAPKDEMSMEISEAEDRLRRLSMAEERQMSAREAAAAQEAAEAAAAAAAAEEDDDEEEEEGMGGGKADKGEEGLPRMSLMDLLGDYDEDEDEDEDEEDYEEEEEEESSEVAQDDDYECSCCVCMVKHKGQPLVPCGHCYCKLCTKEMYVSRGNCPMCNDFIQEILTVF